MKKILFTICVLILTGCSGKNLINGTDADVSTATSSGSQALSVSLIHHGTTDKSGNAPELKLESGHKTFQTKSGVSITLKKAYLSFAHLHLLSEGMSPECIAGTVADVNLLRVQDLLTDDLNAVAVSLTTIAPTDYCQYEIHLSPAGSGFSGLDSESLALGKSVYLQGSWRDGDVTANFEIVMNDEIEITKPFMTLQAEKMILHPLHFHEGETGINLAFGVRYDRLFDDVDFSAADFVIREKIKNNLTKQIYQFVNQPHGTSGATGTISSGSGTHTHEDGSDHVH